MLTCYHGNLYDGRLAKRRMPSSKRPVTFRARLRPDGFVSVDRGSLVTRRIKFDGGNLYVNGVGPIAVEVVTMAENTVTKIVGATVNGDSLNHAVVFDNDRSLRDVAPDGIAQLRFTVGHGGALYSFTIDSSPE